MQPPRTRPTPSIDAPCIRNCCLNDSDICLGCGRTLDEILQWQNFSDAQRAAALQDAQARRSVAKNNTAR